MVVFVEVNSVVIERQGGLFAMEFDNEQILII